MNKYEVFYRLKQSNYAESVIIVANGGKQGAIGNALDTVVEEEHCNLEDIDICHVAEVVE